MTARIPNTNRRQFLGLSGGALAGSLIAARGTASTVAAQDSGRPKELRYLSTNGEVTTLDTYQYSAGINILGFLGLREGLVEYDEAFNVGPLQALEWEQASNGLEYIFHLRQDNTWYDGSPVTAHDYVTAIRYQLTPGQASMVTWNSPYMNLTNALEHNSGAAPADSVGAIADDDFTLRFTLARPYPAFLNAMTGVTSWPMSTAALEQHGELWADMANYMGNGPYRVEELVLQSHITAVPNPAYNLARGNLERITVLFAGRPLEAYQAQEIDLTKLITVNDIVVAQEDPNLSQELLVQPTSGLDHMTFLNNSDNGFYYEHPQVRQAITKSIDTASIVEGIWRGAKTHVPMLSEPIQADFDPTHPHGTYDPEGARQLLAEAGFPDGEGLPPIRQYYPSYHNQEQDYVSSWTAIAQQISENTGLEVKLIDEEIGIYGQHYTAPMNEGEWFGLAYMAFGKPWKDPMHAWDQIITEFTANDHQVEFARLFRAIAAINDGTTTIEGGAPADFDAAIAELTELRDQTLAVYANGAHGEHLRAITESTFDGWIDQATDAANDGKAGTDTATNWQAINEVLARARTEHFLLTNRREQAWTFYELEQTALWTASEDERLALAKQAYDLLAQDSWRIPLWVHNSVHLTRPYVTGVKWSPFWFGDPYQARTISIG